MLVAAQDGARPPDGSRMLRRIADALDRPVSDFYQREAGMPRSEGPSAAEREAMLALFLRIEDAASRERIIALMQRYSGA